MSLFAVNLESVLSKKRLRVWLNRRLSIIFGDFVLSKKPRELKFLQFQLKAPLNTWMDTQMLFRENRNSSISGVNKRKEMLLEAVKKKTRLYRGCESNERNELWTENDRLWRELRDFFCVETDFKFLPNKFKDRCQKNLLERVKNLAKQNEKFFLS